MITHCPEPYHPPYRVEMAYLVEADTGVMHDQWAWLDEQECSDWRWYPNASGRNTFCFARHEDAMLFVLRWGATSS